MPKIIWLSVAEPPPGEAAGEGVRFRGVRPFLTKKDMLRYKILVHLRCVRDFAPPPSDSDSSSSDDPADDRRTRNRHHSAKGGGVVFHPFACRRGAPDGATPPQHDGHGGGGRRHAHAEGPRARVPATQRVGPNGRARVPTQQRLGPRVRVPATLRTGPNGLERVPVHQRLALHKPARHHGPSKKGKQVWRPKQASRQDEPTTSPVEAALQRGNAYAATHQAKRDGPAVCPVQGQQGRHPEDHSQKEKIAPVIRKDGEAARAPRDQPAAGARDPSVLALATASTTCPNEQGEAAAPEPRRTACPVSEASDQDQRQTEVVDMMGHPSTACEPSLITDGGLSPQGYQGHEQGTEAHPAESGLQPNQSTTHKQAGTGDVQEVLTQPDLVVSDGEQGTPISQRRQPQAPPPPQDSASAQRRFKVFARRVKKPLAAPLLKKPSPTKTPAAAQSQDRSADPVQDPYSQEGGVPRAKATGTRVGHHGGNSRP